MASNQLRCHYEVLGLSRDSSPEEIRSAYKKLALRRHPDKLVQSGLSQAEATAQFQELVQAYEVLSDPKERAWYDSHRSQILFSDPNSGNSVPDSVIPNLFSFFSNTVYSGYTDSGRGFYKVYSDVFEKIYSNEVNFCRKLGLGLDSVRDAPLIGNLQCDYAQVSAFYNYWLGFSTVMDFCWVDQYDVMAGQNRKSRRVMEEENKKLRKKARREYNETVRGLGEFVKKRDKRVIDMLVKKNAEMERKKEEEKERKKKLERERMERLRAYEEPEWARVNEEEVDGMEGFEEEEDKGKKGNGGKELYCVVCGKKFKSEKQWKNHEQSKKHKEKVAELRESFQDEDDEREDIEEDDLEKNEDVEEIEERFKEDFNIQREGNGAEVLDAYVNGIDKNNGNVEDEEGEEMSVLEAMVSGHKSRKSRGSRHMNEEFPQEVEDAKEEVEVMKYNNRKTRRRGKKVRGWNNGGEGVTSDIDESMSANEETNGCDDEQNEDAKEEVEVMKYNNQKTRRRGKKVRGWNNGGEGVTSEIDESMNANEETNGCDDEQNEEPASNSFVEDKNDSKIDDHLGKTGKKSNQSTKKKGAATKETNVKSKNSSKGKKGKAISKDSGNACDTCGVEFESRNKLHNHLGDTGHATLKSH
ncbi:DNAJ PROTEIN JJJ1-like protein [Salix koriyanagi]|uniref:DNAJ PROTEIN JJJ1-like protein n=1 Tax=Salix koriyanagi TaxID=2511006 RepID=A0A9Q0YZE2_9ROSI|nr:DNAJ PROTEIN JJJ1-like protein [Salix koriyanagi]